MSYEKPTWTTFPFPELEKMSFAERIMFWRSFETPKRGPEPIKTRPSVEESKRAVLKEKLLEFQSPHGQADSIKMRNRSSKDSLKELCSKFETLESKVLSDQMESEKILDEIKKELSSADSNVDSKRSESLLSRPQSGDTEKLISSEVADMTFDNSNRSTALPKKTEGNEKVTEKVVPLSEASSPNKMVRKQQRGRYSLFSSSQRSHSRSRSEVPQSFSSSATPLTMQSTDFSVLDEPSLTWRGVKPFKTLDHLESDEEWDPTTSRRFSVRRISTDEGFSEFVLRQVVERLESPLEHSRMSVEQVCVETDAKRRKMKNKVRDELISTEQTYVRNLGILVNQYAIPLRNDPKHGLTRDQANTLFSNVETLQQLHGVMLADLKAASAEEFAEVILRSADFLKMYTDYLNGYEKSIEIVNKQSKSKRFTNFLEERRKHGAPDLMSLMILPVQRIPRYELLLKEMVKHTFSSDPDAVTLDMALEKIKEIAGFVNDTKKHVEKMFKLLELQNKVYGLPRGISLFSKERTLLHQGNCQKLSDKKNVSLESGHLYYIYVLTDMILLTNASHKFKALYYLHSVRIFDLPVVTESLYRGFTLKDKKNETSILFPTEKEKKKWVADVLNAQLDQQRHCNGSISTVRSSSLFHHKKRFKTFVSAEVM